jgi:hypothetical protein
MMQNYEAYAPILNIMQYHYLISLPAYATLILCVCKTVFLADKHM